MGVVKKEIAIGFYVGLLATFGTAYLYLEYSSSYDFYKTLALVQEANSYGKLLAIASIPNLLVFFVFLKKNQDNRAKGVLIEVISVALITVFLKFL